MKGRSILGLAVIGALMMSAIATATASAKTVLVGRTAAGVIPAGSKITATSTDLKFVTEAGALECSLNVLEGTLANNSSSKDKGEIEKESSTGVGTGFGSACKTTTPFGPAAIESTHLPWKVEFKSNGTAYVKKGPNGKIAFTSTFVAAPGEPKCTYETAKVISTFTPGAEGSPTTIELTTSEQLFKVSKKVSNEACPSTGKLSGHFTMESKGETVLSELASV